jgi:hypothetical protein
LAGLAVILLFIQDANNGFPKKPIELAFLMRARSLDIAERLFAPLEHWV